jgi:hypothetical protein
MLKTYILKKFDESQISKFLKNVNFNRFNNYPKIQANGLRDYLTGQLKKSFDNGTIFISSGNSDIIAMISLQTLDWDSKHFGYKCASIDYYLYDKNINKGLLVKAFNELLTGVREYALQECIKFISVAIDSWDNYFSEALQSNKYKYILTWIDGIYKPGEKLSLTDGDHEICLMDESELDFYKETAANEYFKGGRFYFDRNFDELHVRGMYSALITSSYSNNYIMLSYRIHGKPVGLFVCKKIITYQHFDNLRVAPLRYLIISPEARGIHIGKNLFSATLNYLSDYCDIITTGLEVHNLASLNLHSKLNFKFNYTHNVFHWRQ